ncbi:MAG: hypothetical protein JNL67_04105 [Planctomycetaceae bacterium]|nr:hypothetical protein [Planctomycetaceae bacterium]
MVNRNDLKAALVSLPDMAERLGVPPLWLKEQAEAGRVPCLRVRRKLMFHDATAEAAVLAMAGNSMSAQILNVQQTGGTQQ